MRVFTTYKHSLMFVYRAAVNIQTTQDTDEEESNFSMLEDTLPEDARMLSHKKTKINQMSWDGVMKLVELQRKSSQLSDNSAQFSRDSVPKPITFAEQQDDGQKLLHEARFLRLPLSNLELWWDKVPVSHPHMFKNIPLKFMGAHNKVSEKTISNLHDRAKPLTLKNFFSQNVCVAAKPLKRLERKGADGIEMIYDFAWEDPASMAEVTESLVNYMTALHQLWPYDPTAIIMLRLINKYKWVNMSNDLREKVSVITTYFNTVMQDNAGRSVRGEPILSFKDQEELFKQALVAHNLPSSVPTSRSRQSLDKDSTGRQKNRQNNGNFSNGSFQSNSGGFPQRSNQQGSRPNYQHSNTNQQRKLPLNQNRPRAMYNNLGVCYGFNNDNCKNSPSASGCKNGNRELAHVCNVWLDQQKSFCLLNHPRSKH